MSYSPESIALIIRVIIFVGICISSAYTAGKQQGRRDEITGAPYDDVCDAISNDQLRDKVKDARDAYASNLSSTLCLPKGERLIFSLDHVGKARIESDDTDGVTQYRWADTPVLYRDWLNAGINSKNISL